MKTIALLLLGIILLLRGTPARAETPFRIMTYNIHHGEGTDGIVDLDRIVTIIRESGADIVCLQEVDRNLPRTGKADFPAELARKLNMAVAFESNYDFDGGEYGNATLSRWPIVASVNHALPRPEGREPRGCLQTTLRVNGALLDVFNTHFGLVADERKQQAAAVLALLSTDRPTIVAGDLNETARAAAVQSLTLKLRDPLLDTPESSIRDGDGEGRRIDFILVSEDLVAVSANVVSTPVATVASDHLPVIAEIVLEPRVKAAPAEGVFENDDDRVEKALEMGR